MYCSWSLLDSRDIKDAWLLQGQSITITPSLSIFFYRCICSFWWLCSCRSAKMLLIWFSIRLSQCNSTNAGEFMCLEHKTFYLQRQLGKMWQKEGNIKANDNIILILFLKMLIPWLFVAVCGPTNSACMCVKRCTSLWQEGLTVKVWKLCWGWKKVVIFAPWRSSYRGRWKRTVLQCIFAALLVSLMALTSWRHVYSDPVCRSL